MNRRRLLSASIPLRTVLELSLVLHRDAAAQDMIKNDQAERVCNGGRLEIAPVA